MTESVTPPTNGGPETTGTVAGAKAKMPTWLSRTVIGAVTAVVLVVGYLIGSVTVPLMWATSIRDQIGGQLGNSIPLGMFYGFVFTFVPVLIAWQAHRRKLNKWVRIFLLALGVVLLIPNLLTLGVIYGNSGSAADARNIWANSANWFGTWSQAFMLVGVVCAVALIVLGRMWLRRSKKLRELKAAEKLVKKDQQSRERAASEEAKEAEKAAARARRNAPKTPAPSSEPAASSGPTPSIPAPSTEDPTQPMA
ncbi:hypothetical protein [Specibacter sp. NPDC078709]|uniref:hypothetical protein n=1 Tax=Specibacter sp. NPDC078709 TaxID=3154364 RepID=UPI00343100A1